jgi:dGTPase
MPNYIDNLKYILEEREEHLSPFASKSSTTKGRSKPESRCPLRLEYQRDRDRIIHCNSFRRLKHKTQVFIAPIGDHFVTRLTHTLEVSQIARTISRALLLNEDLTEAMALGHDLGHTPFGHIGEEVLNGVYPGGFRHNEQSLRIVEYLENNGRGLNLTWEVKNGILHHSKTKVIEIMGDMWGRSGTLEGEVLKISDVVAYINHDIDDAVRANIIKNSDLPESAVNILGNSRSERINTMVRDIVEISGQLLSNKSGEPAIVMSDTVREAMSALHQFLYERVYTASNSLAETLNARNIVLGLFNYFDKHRDLLPPEYKAIEVDPEHQVVDYIAGMTDQYAQIKAKEIDI